MLHMAQKQYIKYLYEVEGKNLAEIQKATGFNYRTVQKYAYQENWSEESLPVLNAENYPSLGAYIPIIDTWLEDDCKLPRKQRHTAWRVFCRLRDEHGFIRTSRGPIEVSLVDVANPCIFVHARDVGILGTESPAEIDGNPELLKYLEEIRGISCIMLGMCDTLEEATKNCPAVPMVCVVSEAADYVNFTNGEIIRKEDIDFVGRLMFMQILHKAYAGTGTACTGAAAKIRGTVLNKIIPNIDEIDTVRIGHPSGIIPVVADVDGIQIKKAAYIRTARRIMEGYVYIEKRKLQ